MSMIEIFDKFCDLFLAGNGIPLPGSNESNHPKREDREPYPPDCAVAAPTRIASEQAVRQRQAADKEFWEAM